METLSQVVSTISIHALLAESDTSCTSIGRPKRCRFLSTLSLRRATSRPQRGPGLPGISIHALLAESDWASQILIVIIDNFYPRSPCGERHATQQTKTKANEFLSTLSLRRATQTRSERANRNIAFLSTLSLRRATWPALTMSAPAAYFYPRSPCGERRIG